MNLNELYNKDTQQLCSIKLAIGSFSEWFTNRYNQFLEFLSSDENITLSVPFVSQDESGNILNKIVMLSKNEFDNILNRDDAYVFDIPCADGTTLSTDLITVDTLVDAVFDCGKSAGINAGLFQYLSNIGSRERVNITDLVSTIKTKVNIPENDVLLQELTSLISGSEMTKDSFLSVYLQNTENSFNPDDFIFNVEQYKDFSLATGIFISVGIDLLAIRKNVLAGFKTIVDGLTSVVSAIKDGFTWIMNHINPGLLQDYEINDKEDGGIIDIPIYHTVLPITDNLSQLFIDGNDWYTWDILGGNYHYRVDFGPTFTYRDFFALLMSSETKYMEIIRSFHIIRLIYLPDDECVDIQIYLTNQGCDEYGQYYSLLPANTSNEAVLTWIYNLMDKAEQQIYKYPCSPTPIPIGSIVNPFWIEHGYDHLFYKGTGFTVNPTLTKPIDLIRDLNFISNPAYLTNPYSNSLASSLLRYSMFQYYLSSEKEVTTGRLYVNRSLYQTYLDNTESGVNKDSFFPYNKVPAIPTLCHCQTNMEIVNEWKTFIYKAVTVAAIAVTAVALSKVIGKIRRNSYIKKLKANEKANAYARGEITYEEFIPYLRKARKYQKLSNAFAPAISFSDGIDDREIDTQLRREIKSVGVLITPTF